MANTFVFEWQPMKALLKAIEIVGSQQKLAELVGVRQSHIAMWKKRGNVPAEYCPAIERATGGKVRCEDLRADVAWEVLRTQVA